MSAHVVATVVYTAECAFCLEWTQDLIRRGAVGDHQPEVVERNEDLVLDGETDVSAFESARRHNARWHAEESRP